MIKNLIKTLGEKFQAAEKRFLPAYVWESDPLTFWRERILFVICFTAAFFGPIALIPSLALAYYEGRWDIIVVDSMAYLTAVAILVGRRLPLKIRAWSACTMLYLLGVGLLFMLGPIGAGYIWLFGASVLIGGIIGLKAAVWSLVLNGFSLASVAVFIWLGQPDWAVSIENVLEKWLVMAINFLLLNALVSITLAFMLGGLQRALFGEQKISDQLRHSEARFRSLFEHSNDAILLHDINGRILEANNRASETLGFDMARITRHNMAELHPETEQRAMKLALGRISEMGNTRYESRLIKSDGSVIEVDISSRFADSDKGIIQAVVRDITERNFLQKAVQQAQKMEAIGRLAGGVAHDFNNLLSIIIGNSELMLIGLKKDDPAYAFTKDVIQAGNRGASLTRQLLAFSRKQVVQPKVVDLNRLLIGMEKMLHRLIKEDIHLKVVYGSSLWPVMVDPGQMEQVLMNLTVNASDAMPTGGRLLIETGNADMSDVDTHHARAGLKPGSYVMVKVVDTGIGISLDNQSQVFDPFFTTKEVGEGTGLGLSTVYGIVQQAGGCIVLNSASGQGTTFRTYLPRVRPTEKPALDMGGSPDRLHGSETVLIVEDDASVRKLALNMLLRYGYQARAAETSVEALEILKLEGPTVDLLLTDVIMPDMGGPELVARLKPSHPKIKVLYMSGYTDDAIVNRGVLDPGINLIEKPFSTKSLVKKVREVLDQPQS